MHALVYYPLLITAIYLALTIILFAFTYLLPRPPTLIPFAARCLSSYAALLVCATYGVLASIILRAFSLHRLAQWTTARAFAYTMRYATGVTFSIPPADRLLLDSKRPVVIIGNHQSELDVLMLGQMFPKYTSVTAKKSLRNVPFLGWFMTLSGTVFIDRVDRSQAMKAFEGAAREMKEHRQNVFIFPEGTRSYAEKPILLPFKKGAFHLAVQAGVDILPVVVENYSRVLNVKARRFNSGTIRVKGTYSIPLRIVIRVPALTMYNSVTSDPNKRPNSRRRGRPHTRNEGEDAKGIGRLRQRS
jgi:lysophosphatidate acyltransferase